MRVEVLESSGYVEGDAGKFLNSVGATLYMSVNNFNKCSDIIFASKSQQELPEKLLKFTIAIEDRRYRVHRGYDPFSIARVILKRMLGNRGGGASTIGQQFARTVTNDREPSFRRKAREIALSMKLDKAFSKDEILTAYLRVAYLGTNVEGVDRFSQAVFNKGIEALNENELAIVASALRYPVPLMNKNAWWKKVKQRAKYAQLKAEQSKWIK